MLIKILLYVYTLFKVILLFEMASPILKVLSIESECFCALQCHIISLDHEINIAYYIRL